MRWTAPSSTPALGTEGMEHMTKTKITAHGKRIACIFAALTLLAGSGCGQTKETPATFQTNTEQHDAQATAASAKSDDRPLSEQLGAPER